MSLADSRVYFTQYDDGSADLTISIDEDDHKFSVSADGENAVLTFEETMTWRGRIETSEPREEVWKLVMQSDEMTEYLEANGLDAVRRNR